eukprot:6010351-Pleurochrysis_carterae.AAC.1
MVWERLGRWRPSVASVRLAEAAARAPYQCQRVRCSVHTRPTESRMRSARGRDCPTEMLAALVRSRTGGCRSDTSHPPGERRPGVATAIPQSARCPCCVRH